MSVQDTFSYDVGKNIFPNEDAKLLHAWLGSDIRIIVLFTDVGSSRFRGFIVDYTFLRLVGNIFFILALILYANVRHSQVSELPQTNINATNDVTREFS